MTVHPQHAPDGDQVAACLPDVAAYLSTVSLTEADGDLRALRERHLSRAVHVVLGARLGTAVAARVLRLPEWPRLGRGATDFVAWSDPARTRPVYAGELKWCQEGDDKTHEAIWDLFKMALVARTPSVRTAYLITGAPAAMWSDALAADVFAGGTFDVEELCGRRFARGSRRSAWDNLLEGGYDRHPDRVPATLTTTPTCPPVDVVAAERHWVLKAVAVAGSSPGTDVAFAGGWPHGRRPADARNPLAL